MTKALIFVSKSLYAATGVVLPHIHDPSGHQQLHT